ncbi:MAG: hypothetical protein U9Q74_01960 [Gemmatimonadota bacterium]|nr:hypothetical protein [Gemmatimonadota bacterium]
MLTLAAEGPSDAARGHTVRRSVGKRDDTISVTPVTTVMMGQFDMAAFAVPMISQRADV